MSGEGRACELCPKGLLKGFTKEGTIESCRIKKLLTGKD
jgi:hypothetical protein